MKANLLMMILIGGLLSCRQRPSEEGNTPLTQTQLMDQAIRVAESYAMHHLGEGRKTTLPNGTILFEDSMSRYALEPGRLYAGLINEDDMPDAIVTLATYQGPRQTTSEHLILLNSGNILELKKVIQSNMDILRIRDRIISADVPTHDRNSPLFDCESCRDVIQYKFTGGELVKVE
jgi:hypothetical protein